MTVIDFDIASYIFNKNHLYSNHRSYIDNIEKVNSEKCMSFKLNYYFKLLRENKLKYEAF
jgi:hypothetical protein